MSFLGLFQKKASGVELVKGTSVGVSVEGVDGSYSQDAVVSQCTTIANMKDEVREYDHRGTSEIGARREHTSPRERLDDGGFPPLYYEMDKAGLPVITRETARLVAEGPPPAKDISPAWLMRTEGGRKVAMSRYGCTPAEMTESQKEDFWALALIGDEISKVRSGQISDWVWKMGGRMVNELAATKEMVITVEMDRRPQMRVVAGDEWDRHERGHRALVEHSRDLVSGVRTEMEELKRELSKIKDSF